MTSTDLALPSNASVASWTPQQTRLMAFAGLAIIQGNGNILVPDPGLAEAFIAICNRTGLDPIAKQIYAANMGGKLTIVVGIDGFRVIAQRSKHYAGQIGPQFTDGTMIPKYHPKTGAVIGEEMRWLDAWPTPGTAPLAARIGILRSDFSEPLWQTVSWAEFGANGSGPNWNLQKGRPVHMLGIRAEGHGLRRAFPNDLSGLYLPEDIDGVGEIEQDGDEARLALIERVEDQAELRRLHAEWFNTTGVSPKVAAAMMARAGALAVEQEEPRADAPQGPGEEIAEPVDENPSETPEPAQSHTAAPDEDDEDVRLARRIMPEADFAEWMKTRAPKGGQA